MSVKFPSLSEEYEILLQMIELAHQSSDYNLIVYTYHYASQYYRHLHQLKEAAEFLQRAINICSKDNPLKRQLQEEYDLISGDQNHNDLTYWIISKTGPVLVEKISKEQKDKITIDSDLFGMFFTALQQFASECAGVKGAHNIQSIKWNNGAEFLIFHHPADSIFIVGISPIHRLSTDIYEALRRTYYRFKLIYERDLAHFQGNIKMFENFC